MKGLRVVMNSVCDLMKILCNCLSFVMTFFMTRLLLGKIYPLFNPTLEKYDASFVLATSTKSQPILNGKFGKNFYKSSFGEEPNFMPRQTQEISTKLKTFGNIYTRNIYSLNHTQTVQE